MEDGPNFLSLPTRPHKPRRDGLTHVIDKGMPIAQLEATLAHCGQYIDVLKVGWGIAYVDPNLKDRVSLCAQADVMVSLGGTLLEICAAQGKVTELRRWAAAVGVDCMEVSNGLGVLSRVAKTRLIQQLSADFTVLAETGAKAEEVPVVPTEWLEELEADLAAGARWLVTEGRESGSVGLYDRNGTPRAGLVDRIASRLPRDRVIFEAPRKSQQAWLIGRLGPEVNLGNVALDDVLPLETLRLGLRADTAKRWPPRRIAEVAVCS